MLNKRMMITMGCLGILLGLILTGVDDTQEYDPVKAQTGATQDICGRELFNSAGIPRYYKDSCSNINNFNLSDAPNSYTGDRFELPYRAYSTGGSWVDAVSMDDFDGDGKLDMALSTSSYFDPVRDHRVWLAKQNSPSDFELVYSEGVGAIYPKSLDVADMNGDGYLDIFVANSNGGPAAVGDVEIFWDRRMTLRVQITPPELRHMR